MGANHGGARPGAGRPSNQEKHREAIATFADLAARGLTQCFDNLCTLADGGFERTESRWMPAGMVTRKEAARGPDGEVLFNRAGNPLLVDVHAFPGKPADELVLVERKVTTVAPDFRANEYLVNRVMGTPIPAPAPDPELLNIRDAVTAATAAMAARKARPPASDEPPALPPEAEGGADDGDDD
jgi:hypothetical protein